MAAQTFGKGAQHYHRARRGYPSEALDLLAKQISHYAQQDEQQQQQDKRYLVDLGSGTGLLAQDLLPYAATLGERAGS